MMHGMTGNAAMMRPFAEKILPDGWTLLVPEARLTTPSWLHLVEVRHDETTRRMSSPNGTHGR